MPGITNAAVLRWAARRFAVTPRQISDLTHVSAPTVRAWRDTPRAAASPRILLIFAAIEAGVAPCPDISTPEQLAAVRRSGARACNRSRHSPPRSVSAARR